MGGLLAEPPSIGSFLTYRGSFGSTGRVRAHQNLVAGAAEGAPESTVAGARESTALVGILATLQEHQKEKREDNLRMLHALDGIRKSHEEGSGGTKGTVSSLKRNEELDVYLARGCGALQVDVCTSLVGTRIGVRNI